MQTAGNVGPINGQPPLTPRTPAPSMDSQDKDQASKQSEDTIESGRPRNTTEEEGLANLAESIHINPPAMAMMTKAPIIEAIDEHMGHCYDSGHGLFSYCLSLTSSFLSVPAHLSRIHYVISTSLWRHRILDSSILTSSCTRMTSSYIMQRQLASLVCP